MSTETILPVFVCVYIYIYIYTYLYFAFCVTIWVIGCARGGFLCILSFFLSSDTGMYILCLHVLEHARAGRLATCIGIAFCSVVVVVVDDDDDDVVIFVHLYSSFFLVNVLLDIFLCVFTMTIFFWFILICFRTPHQPTHPPPPPSKNS